jgi:2'-5' RNA ligase
MPDVRTFIAVDLPSKVKEQIGEIVGRLRPLGAAVGWVRPEGLHLTLKFLGEIPQEQLARISPAIQAGVATIAPFSFVLAQLGGFPNLQRPRVLWIGVPEGHEGLKRLQGSIEEQLLRLGFPGEDRAFSPHLTIGRVKSPQGLGPLLAKLPSISFRSDPIPVSEVKLMRSQLRPTGAEYSALEVFALKAGDSSGSS